MEWAESVVYPKKKDVTYCLMVDAPIPYPIDRIGKREVNGIDAIRIIVWKEKIQECVEYSKKLIDKGYQVFIQPARVSQYSVPEFEHLIYCFSKIDITAFYVVDSWGTEDSCSITSYMNLSWDWIGDKALLGYHGHNHKQQALSCAEEILQYNTDVILDCSIFGMGRGAGNLNTELIMAHLNDRYEKHYNIKPILNAYSNYIKDYYDEFGWGYSMKHFMTAIFNCNARYINYIMDNTNLSMDRVYEIFQRMTEKQRIDYSETLIKELINDARS